MRNWTVDEHGTVSPGKPVSFIGKARLRRFAGFSGGSWLITPESVRAARDLGIPADQVLAWLNAHLSHEVPPVLASAIRNWAGGRGKVFLGNVVLLQINDLGAFDALRRSARLRPLVKGTLSPGCLIVEAETRENVAKLLRELGFALDAPCKLESDGLLATLPGPAPKPKAAHRRKLPNIERSEG